jgi:hypothetical protein
LPLITPSASSLLMQVRLQSRCCAGADALTTDGMVIASAIVFVLVASR